MPAASQSAPLARAAFLSLLAVIFSLAFMQPSFRLLGFAVAPTDPLFAIACLLWLGALLTGQAALRWRNAYWLMAFYFAALAASGLQDLATALPKLATQLYLLGLAVLASQLIDRHERLRAAVLTWLAGTAVVCVVGLASLALFAWNPEHPLLDKVLFHYGTLVPGNYPRLRLTFLNANMLCNYLAVSLALLLAARHLGWLPRAPFILLTAGIAVAALFTISPGLAGLVLAAGLWIWLLWRSRRPLLGRMALLAGLGAAAASIPVMALTPVLHSTAPFLIPLPGTDLTLAPAGRLMIWMDAARNFLAEPWLGRGIGNHAVRVQYLDPSGVLQTLTDAHNSFLNIAVQTGLAGLSALLLIIGFAAKAVTPLRLAPDRANTLRLALGLAFLNGIAVQGLGGSFEDARHLWVCFGLLLAADRLERASA